MKVQLLRICLFLIFLSTSKLATAQIGTSQLGLCKGNSGTPIFSEDFGAGTIVGPQLAPGITTYTFTTALPVDGNYSVSSNSNYFGWHVTDDRTPGDVDGKMLIVNASSQADEFYRRTITGLCENTTYEFSSWLINLLPINNVCSLNDPVIPINVKFEILDANGVTVLKAGDTDDIFGTQTPQWNQYGLVFKTLLGQTSVVLKMSNNGNGGCGNDLAIDDIVFKTCGDTLNTIDNSGNTSSEFCEGTFTGITLDANPDKLIFNSHAYQWQESNDAINWQEIPGENNQTYTRNTAPLGATYYRVIASENAINLNSSKCNVISDTYQLSIHALPNAPVSNGDVFICENDPISGIATVNVNQGETVNWYDSQTNGTIVANNNTSFRDPSFTVGTRTFYAETINTTTGCISTTRTPIDFTVHASPNAPVSTRGAKICEGSTASNTATVTVNQGQTVNWYDVPNGGIAITTGTSYTDPNTTVGTRTFYAEAVNTTTRCASTTRTQVDFIVHASPNAPVSNGGADDCEGSTASNTATVTVNQGETVNWYDVANGGIAITTGTSYTDPDISVGSRTFYTEAVNTTTGCISAMRTPVIFTVHENPNAPVSTEGVSICENDPVLGIATVTVNQGETVNWYDAPSNGTIVASNNTSFTDPNTTVGTRTFYAEAVNTTTGCTSTTRTQVDFTVHKLPIAPIGVSPGLVCDELDFILNVNTSANTDIQINWYDIPNGGKPVQENSTTLNVTNSGTYYAEAVNINTGCISINRTGITINFSQTIVLDNELLSFCQGQSITLSPAITGDSYLWSTGETSREITVTDDGVYDVSITNLNACSTFQIFTIEELESQPVVIENIRSDNRNIIVQVNNPNDFEYSLDGFDFQESPVFRNLQGGRYTIYIQSTNGCTSLSREYLHMVIPKFFTPNGDGINEMFTVEGFENVEQYSMNIFDRYGKLIANYSNIANGWNGMYNNQMLPSSDYWYAINVNGEQFKGHVTLKR